MKFIKKHKKKIIISILIVLIIPIVIAFSYASFTSDSSKTGSITTISSTFCMDNNINKLSDCIKAQNANNANIQTAESIIQSRTYDTTKTSPTVSNIYEKKVKQNVYYKYNNSVIANYSSLNDLLSYSDTEPVFNSSTGYYPFTYSGKKTVQELLDDITSGNIKYICNTTSTTTANCSYIYVLNEVKKVGSRYYGTFDYFTYKTTISSSDSGLYAADDYNNTKSYFYRGKIDNNYVRFAGNYYKIIRINGDGSIRLIYVGPTASTTQGIANASFNSTTGRIYSLFYMYGDTKTRASYNTQASLKSYFFDNYNSTTGSYDDEPCTYDSNTNEAICTLKGHYITGSFNTVKNQLKTGYDGDGIHPYKYSCDLGTFDKNTETMTCYDYYFLIDFDDARNNSNVSQVYGSIKGYFVSEDNQRLNTKSSNAKAVVDSWYESNILNNINSYGNSYDTYLADSIFCADRTYASNSPYKGVGEYQYDKDIYYKNYGSEYGRNLSYTCSDVRDRFTVNVTDQNRGVEGNGALTYKVGLITVNDIYYAGSLISAGNSNNYLKYGYTSSWTMTPRQYTYSFYGSSTVYILNSSGKIASSYPGSNYIIRPVINLNKDIYITGGNGSSTSPYQVISKQEYDSLHNN